MNHCILEVQVKTAPKVRFTQDNQTPIAEIEAQFASLRADDPPSTIKVVGWGKLAEELKTKVQINSKLIIEGRLRMNSIPRQDGTKEKRTEFTLSRLHQLSPGNPSSVPFKAESNTKKNSSAPIENEAVKWDSSPLIPDTDDIPF